MKIMTSAEEYNERFFMDDGLDLVVLFGEVQKDSIGSFVKWYNENYPENYILKSRVDRFNLRI